MKQILAMQKNITILSIIILISSCEENSETTQIENTWLEEIEQVNAQVENLNGLKLIKLWGTPHEQGYAYGYLLGPNLIDFMNNLKVEMNIESEDWNNAVEQNLSLFKIPTEYEIEIQGIIDGMEARNNNNEVYITELEKYLTKEDLIGLNCDLLRISCSSLSAWGEVTYDGSTITGRNMDYENSPSFVNNQILVVRIPNSDSDKKAWISINFLGDLGCTSGMNEDGLTISQQDVTSNTPSITTGFTPDNYIHRLIIENVSIDNVKNDISTILLENHSFLGCAPLISWPYKSNNISAIIPEFDGVISKDNGFNIRLPETGNDYIIGTNHFRKRDLPMDDCWRFNYLENSLDNIINGTSSKLTKNACIQNLKQTPIPELICMHSVVFEPNKKVIHISFTNGINHATESEFVTINIKDLLSIL